MSTSNTAGPATWRRLLIVLAIWIAIYLPGLGTLEIKGEEGRRILPAVTMIETGHYVVPQVGSDAYFAKPPLVNWLVAASFRLFGVRNEWAARLPSALCVLAVALAFITLARGALGENGSLIAALIWMTNFGMIEKGRLIEIEALYVSLCGLALICWLSWWHDGRSRWLLWTVPWLFLGLGILAKGPLHLVFFYAIVVAVLLGSRELRTLLNPAHLVGIALMIGIFAAWAWPALQMTSNEPVTQTWARQFSGRLSGEDFNLGGWSLNIPRGFGYFLPWVLLLPLYVKARFANGRDTQVAQGLMWGVVMAFFAVSLLPGALARYTMPLLVPATWLVAMLLTAPAIALPGWLRLRRPGLLAPELRLPAFVAALVCFAIAIYAFAAMPFLNRREKVRNVAAKIQAAVPREERLYAVDPDYQPFLFYICSPLSYVARLSELPPQTRFFVVQSRNEKEVLTSQQWGAQRPREVTRVTDYRRKTVIVYALGPA